MASNFIINPSSVSREAILADLDTFLASTPDTAKWRDFFKSQTGQTVKELIAGFGAFLSFNAIVARREAFWKNAVNRSSVIGGAQSQGYSAFRGRNQVLQLTVTPIVTGVLNKYSTVGSVKDQNLILLNDTILNAGVSSTVDVVIGTLATEDIIIDTDSLASFRFTKSLVSDDVRLLLNDDTEVTTSSRILDLSNEKFVLQSNPIGSVDVMYLNFDTFAVRYAVGDKLTLQWVALKELSFNTIDVNFDFGTLIGFTTVSAYQDPESLNSIKVNASLFNETQFVVRGRNDYLKILKQLDSNLVNTNGFDISPAIVGLSYVLDDYSLYLTSEKNTLLQKLTALRTFGVPPPDLEHPGIVFLTLDLKAVLLPNQTGDATGVVNTAVDQYQQVLSAAVDFEEIENLIERQSFIKVARVSVDAPVWVPSAEYVRGHHTTPISANGFIYEVVGFIYRSGAVEPSWSCTVDDTVIDGDLIWKVETIGTCDSPSNWTANTRYHIGDIVKSPSLCSGKMFQVVEYINRSASSQEVQKIQFSSVPVSGTWRAEFGGNATTDLAYNANAGAVQTALNALDGLSDVIVAGNYTDGFTVTFAGVDANMAQPNFTFSNPGVNEIQCLEFSGTPNAGNFSLNFNGQTTAVLGFNSTALQIQTALENLSNVGAGNVQVSGNFGNNFNITYINALAKTNWPQLTVPSNSLTNSTSVTSVITTIQDGRPPVTGHNEIQTFQFDRVASVGTYSLNFDAQYTALLQYDATASDVQAALEAISTVGAGNVTVTGDRMAGFTVTFQGALQKENVVSLETHSSTLTRYQAATPTIVTYQQGSGGFNEVQKLTFDYVPDSGNWQMQFNYGGLAEETDVTCNSDLSGDLNNKYWIFSTIAAGYYVWYNVDGAGVDPAVSGRTGIEVDIASNSPANTVAAATLAAIQAAASANVTATAVSSTKIRLLNTAQGVVTDANGQTSGFICVVLIQGVNPIAQTGVLTPTVTHGQLQAALEALPNIGAGNVEVQGDFVNGFIISFIGDLANLNVAQLSVINNTMIQTQTTNIVYATSLQGVPDDAGDDEIQKIAFSTVPDSGTWALNFNGQITSTLNFNDNALAVENALNTLPALGGVTVSGDFALGFTITFAGINGKVNQPTLLMQNTTLFSNSVAIDITPCTVTDGLFPAQNLLNVSNGAVAVNSVKLSNAVNPEPSWFSGQVVC